MGPGGQAQPLRYLGGDTFSAGGTRLTFVRENGKIARIRADMVAGNSVLRRMN
jgi:hypothetical protein